VLDWSDGVHMVRLVLREGCSAQKSGQCTCYCQTGMRVIVSEAVGVYHWGLVPEAVPVGGHTALCTLAGVPGKVFVVSCCFHGREATGLAGGASPLMNYRNWWFTFSNSLVALLSCWREAL